MFGLGHWLCEKGKIKERFSREKEMIKEKQDLLTTKEQGNKAQCALLLEARRWVIQVYLVRNLNTRLDKVIGSKMDKVRGWRGSGWWW